MKSNIKQAKMDLEQEFQQHWAKTSVQYEGTDISSLPTWIGLKFTPVSAEALTQRKIEHSILTVSCYADSPTSAYGLMDDVIDFLQSRQVGSVYVGCGDYDGLGCQEFKNNLHEVAAKFTITKA